MKYRLRPFILLEVLIAISILALVIVPLSSFPFKALKKEREMLILVESERVLSLAHADLLTYLQEHPPTEKSIDLGNYELELTTLGKFSYHAMADLTSEKSKERHHLYKVTLSLTSSSKQSLPHTRSFNLYWNEGA